AVTDMVTPDMNFLSFLLFLYPGNNVINQVVLDNYVIRVINLDARGIGGAVLIRHIENFVVSDNRPRSALDSNTVGIATAGATHAVDLHILNHHAAHPAVAGAEHAHAQRRRALNMKTVDDNIIPR